MHDCKTCEGTGMVKANGSLRPCHVCDGYGYIGIPSLDDTPLTPKQASWVFVLAGVIILCAFVIGNFGG